MWIRMWIRMEITAETRDEPRLHHAFDFQSKYFIYVCLQHGHQRLYGSFVH